MKRKLFKNIFKLLLVVGILQPTMTMLGWIMDIVVKEYKRVNKMSAARSDHLHKLGLTQTRYVYVYSAQEKASLYFKFLGKAVVIIYKASEQIEDECARILRSIRKK